jgi:hypothetical protein
LDIGDENRTDGEPDLNIAPKPSTLKKVSGFCTASILELCCARRANYNLLAAAAEHRRVSAVEEPLVSVIHEGLHTGQKPPFSPVKSISHLAVHYIAPARKRSPPALDTC